MRDTYIAWKLAHLGVALRVEIGADGRQRRGQALVGFLVRSRHTRGHRLRAVYLPKGGLELGYIRVLSCTA